MEGGERGGGSEGEITREGARDGGRKGGRKKRCRQEREWACRRARGDEGGGALDEALSAWVCLRATINVVPYLMYGTLGTHVYLN